MSCTESYIILKYGKPRASHEYIRTLPFEVVKETLSKAFAFNPTQWSRLESQALLFSMLLHPVSLEKASPVIINLLAEHHDKQR